MKSLDLQKEHLTRRPQQPPVIRPRASTVPGLKGTLPLKPGEVIISEHEKKKLRKYGWKDGDPLPGNIAQLMAREQNYVATDLATAKPFKNRPIFKPAEPVDISEVDESYRSDLQRSLQQFKELAPQIEAVSRGQQDVAGLSPEIQKAIFDASGGVEVVDSREEEAPADPIRALQQRINKAEGKAPSEDDEFGQDGTGLEPSPEDMKGEVEPHIELTNCPRCNCNLTTKLPEPPMQDKQAYVAAVLGDQVFKKTYNLFGGRVRITFRALTSARGELAYNQVAHEVRVGLSHDPSYRQLMLYRMVLALDSIETQGSGLMDIGEQVDSFLDDPTESEEVKWFDALPIIVKRLQQVDLLRSESVWRACRACFDNFNALVDDLDARAENSDFWNAIAS